MLPQFKSSQLKKLEYTGVMGAVAEAIGKLFHHLPITLKKLTIHFPEFFHNLDIPINLLPNVTHLNLMGAFNQEIANLLPHSITHLYIGDKFSRTLGELPPHLTHLDVSVPAFYISLPKKLKCLRIGHGFSGSLDDLPESLVYLRITSRSFPLDYVISKLPSKLQYLEIESVQTIRIDCIGKLYYIFFRSDALLESLLRKLNIDFRR